MARPSQGMAGGQDAAGGDLGALERHVQAGEANGAVRVALGSCPMPDGYALMQDLADGTFFWLRADGAESLRHYSRWEIWRLAIRAVNPSPSGGGYKALFGAGFRCQAKTAVKTIGL